MVLGPTLNATCSCGNVVLELYGAPITSAVCYCDDCQAGAKQIEALAGAPHIRTSDGGTAYVVYRKDRVRRIKGGHLLESLKINPTSPTSRMIASCCNSGMCLSFDDSKHWIDIYRDRIESNAPAIEMRICTKFAPEPTKLPSDVPSYAGYPFRLIGKLVSSKLAMMFNL